MLRFYCCYRRVADLLLTGGLHGPKPKPQGGGDVTGEDGEGSGSGNTTSTPTPTGRPQFNRRKSVIERKHALKVALEKNGAGAK